MRETLHFRNRTLRTPFSLLQLAMLGLMFGCAPTVPPAPQGPDVELKKTGATVTPGERDDARRLLDELALSAILATGRIDYRIYTLDSNGAVTLNDRVDGAETQRVKALDAALQAANRNRAAARALQVGIERARDFCKDQACDDDKVRIELVRLEPPAGQSGTPVRITLSGSGSAVCNALAEAERLYSIEKPGERADCDPALDHQFFDLDVGPLAAAQVKLSLQCPTVPPIPASPTIPSCCSRLDARGRVHYGEFYLDSGTVKCSA